MDDAEYRQLHEDFMRNLTGTTPWEAVLALTPGPLSVLLIVLITPWLVPVTFYKAPVSFQERVLAIVEFPLLIGPLLLSLTLLSDVCHVVVVVLISMCVGLLNVNHTLGFLNFGIKDVMGKLAEMKAPQGKQAFITNYRAAMNIATTFCILAVDFRTFPRRFAKTENYGFGLMDVGVGSFIISHAVVSPEARFNKERARKFPMILPQIGRAWKGSLPLILLGLVRLASVKQTMYHEHMTEYGVHWNFFFTLAAVKIASSTLLLVFPVSQCLLLSFAVIVSHEWLLESGVREWLLSDDPRVGFLEANREGICSSLGYVALYFAGVAIGQYLNQPREFYSDWVWALMIGVAGKMMWLTTSFSTIFLDFPSRRMANFTYFCWVLSYNLMMLTMFLLVDLIVLGAHEMSMLRGPSGYPAVARTSAKKVTISLRRSPCLLEAVSYNGLFFFLAGNLVTGLVNVTIRTLLVDDMMAVFLLSVYMMVLFFPTMLLYDKKLKLKVW